MSISKRLAWLLAILATFSLIAAACGGDDEETEATEEPAEETPAEEEPAEEEPAEEEPAEEEPAEEEPAGDLSGEIFASGSSTVGPITIRVQELFNEVNPGVNIAVDTPGTGDGFAAFCNGETDISNASRAISEEEIANCADAGIEYTELLVGIDGIAVMTNADNDAVECVSFADIYGLVGPESTGFSSWADANELSTELGGAGTLPDAPLDIFGPGEESGTFDSFVELVLEDFAEERGQDATTRPDYNPSGDDNVILQGVEGSTTSFGWVGYAFARADELVKLLQVDDGESGCVEANDETIASGEYPISRPLFIYVNNAKAAENPAVGAFVDFFLTDDGLETAILDVGYVPLADDAKQAVRDAWAAAG